MCPCLHMLTGLNSQLPFGQLTEQGRMGLFLIPNSSQMRVGNIHISRRIFHEEKGRVYLFSSVGNKEIH